MRSRRQIDRDADTKPHIGGPVLDHDLIEAIREQELTRRRPLVIELGVRAEMVEALERVAPPLWKR